jgi:hypothetical protein
VSEAFAQALARGDGIRDPAAWVWRVAFLVAGAELNSGPGHGVVSKRFLAFTTTICSRLVLVIRLRTNRSRARSIKDSTQRATAKAFRPKIRAN